MWIISINGEEPITSQGALDQLHCHKNPRRKSKVKISLYRSKICHRTELEENLSIFDQFIPVVSHTEVILPNKTPIPNNIGEGVKVSERKF